MKVAIIGMGISGSSVLKELVDRQILNSDLSLDIYEPRDQIAVGSAYGQDDSVLLMNSYSKRLSLNEDNPNDFMEWLQVHHPNLLNDDFVPRQIFGDYLIDRYGHYADQANVRWIKDEVHDLTIMPAKDSLFPYSISLKASQSREWIDYDYVFMTIGHPPYADYYNLVGEDNYIHNPYPVSDQLVQIPPHHRIGIIGSSLTALDILHFIEKLQLSQHPVTLFIRHHPFTNVKSKLYDGPLKLSIDQAWIDQKLEEFVGKIPLKVIYQQIISDFNEMGVDLDQAIQKYQTGSVENMRLQILEEPLDLQIIQRYIGIMTAVLPELNMALSPSEREIFHHQYKRLFEHFRTQFPSIKMNLLLDWLDQGQVKIVTGLKSIHLVKDEFIVETQENYSYKMDTIINATGFEQCLDKAGRLSPLIHHLFEKEIISQNPLGGILVSWPAAHPLSPTYGEITNLSLSGLVIHQTQFGNNNAQMTAKHGKQLALNFINQIN